MSTLSAESRSTKEDRRGSQEATDSRVGSGEKRGAGAATRRAMIGSAHFFRALGKS
jgi:hypothetical protein